MKIQIHSSMQICAAGLQKPARLRNPGARVRQDGSHVVSRQLAVRVAQ